MNKTKITPAIYDAAVTMYAHTPQVHHKDVADKLGISNKSLLSLRNNPSFWSDVYDTFMVSFEGEIIEVVRAMIREGKNGNSSAARLGMEFSGKLKQHINVTVLSPFEKWLADNGIKDIQDAEIVVERNESSILPPSQDDLIKLDADRNKKREYIKLDKELQKKQAWNKRRRELHRWNKRAKTCGIEPLPARRPTPGPEGLGEKYYSGRGGIGV